MINYNWYDRPSASMLVRYLEEDKTGCFINNKLYHRPQILAELNRLNIIHNKNDYLLNLCNK